MEKNTLFQDLLTRFDSADIFSPDFPDETAETTIKALWSTALGNPCSAVAAKNFEPSGKLSENKQAILMSLVEKRLAGTPLAHLTGRVQFMNTELLFEPDVFLVRPETEILGLAAAKILNEEKTTIGEQRLIDMGCGSGNLTCGIAHSVEQLKVWSIDISEKCTALAVKNIVFCGLSDRVTVVRGDLFAPVNSLGLKMTIDAVICNPPYIATSRLAGDRSYLLNHEPLEAFDGGPFGFGLHLRLIKESLEYLRPRGHLLFEFGVGQHVQVRRLFERNGGYDPVDFSDDENGFPRVVVAKKKG